MNTLWSFIAGAFCGAAATVLLLVTWLQWLADSLLAEMMGGKDDRP